MATTWEDISKAGGIDAWVQAELSAKGLTDPAAQRPVKKALHKDAWKAYKQAHLVFVGAGIFHHDTADIDKFDVADVQARREENQLPKIDDVPALAKALELTIPRLRWLVFHREVDTGTHYRRWKIPKRDGSSRLISSPKKDLMRVQRWIAKNITEHLPVHEAAHGFLVGRSTKSNALPHAGARIVVKIDLKDFYPTVTFPRVKGVFRKAGYGEQVATILALLVTESPREELELRGKKYWVATGPRSLPQGAPTSPSLTNTLFRRPDSRIFGLAQKFGLEYTRYADDLTFSRDNGRALGKFFHRLRGILKEEGFRVHPEKTAVMRTGARQRVTGLVVNRAAPDRPKARVPREVVRRLRAAIHNREHGKAREGESLAQLRGLAAYIFMVDRVRGKEFMERIDRLEAPEGERT